MAPGVRGSPRRGPRGEKTASSFRAAWARCPADPRRGPGARARPPARRRRRQREGRRALRRRPRGRRRSTARLPRSRADADAVPADPAVAEGAARRVRAADGAAVRTRPSGDAVLPARALFTRLPDPGAIRRALRPDLATGEEISLPRVVERLTRLGYRRGDLVDRDGRPRRARRPLRRLSAGPRPRRARRARRATRIASIRALRPRHAALAARGSRGPRCRPSPRREESEEARRLLTERLGRLPSEAERVVFAPAVSPMPAGWLDHAARTRSLVVVEPAAVEEEIAGVRRAPRRGPRPGPRRRSRPRSSLHPGRADPRARSSRRGLRFDRLGARRRRRGAPSGCRPRRSPATRGRAARGGRGARARARVRRGGRSSRSRPTGGAEKLRRLAIEYGFHVSSERRRGRRRLDAGRDLGGLPPARAAPRASTPKRRSSARSAAPRPRAASPPRRSSRTCGT